jgi:hypothetical protein
MSSTFTISKPVFKKFCKVCQDAGKSESEYTSHNVRESKDPKSKTLCPTLLAQECRHCFRKGHTVKYCSILKKQQMPPTPYVGTSDKKKKPEITNVFMLLESESESEGEGEGEGESDRKQILPTLDYTNIIRITMGQQQEQSQNQSQTQIQVQISAATIPRVIGKSRWLDVVSSSDEEDDSEEE